MNSIRKIASVPRNSIIKLDGKFLKGIKMDETDGKVKVYILDFPKGRTIELSSDTEIELIESGKYTLEIS